MTAFVTADDLQSCAHGEANAGNKRIFEPDVVYIVGGGAANELTGGLVAGQEAIKNGEFDSRARHNLLGRWGALAHVVVAAAPMIPETWVPWLLSSKGSQELSNELKPWTPAEHCTWLPLKVVTVKLLVADHTFAARSGWV